MILEHLSDYGVRQFRDVEVEEQRSRSKPVGVWFASPGDWASWIRTTGPEWFCTTEIADRMICTHPWSSDGTGGTDSTRSTRIIELDMSCEDQLDGFIERFRCDGFGRHEVDWRKVQVEFGGVYFRNADVRGMPPHYGRKFGGSDGCWVLSIDVDSVCVWNTRSLGPLRWTWTASPEAKDEQTAEGCSSR